MSRSSMMRSLTRPSLPEKSGPAKGPGPVYGRALAQAFRRKGGNRLIVFRRHEAGARIDVHRAETVDDLLAQAENGQITLLERLLVRREVDPSPLERLNDLRARIEADVDDVASVL